MVENRVSEHQLIVTYWSASWDDTSGKSLSELLLRRIAQDAGARELDGWSISAWDSLLTGFTGTSTNWLFNSGGGFATDVAVTVVYSHA